MDATGITRATFALSTGLERGLILRILVAGLLILRLRLAVLRLVCVVGDLGILCRFPVRIGGVLPGLSLSLRIAGDG